MSTDTVTFVSPSQNRKRGFTLTEIAIVLGIIGLILGAVWAAASSVYSNANATKFAEQLSVYLASARTVCQNGCNGTIGGISASIPTIPGVSLSTGYPETAPTSGTGFMLLQWQGVPATTSGTNFCASLATAVSSIGGIPATTGATADSLTVPQTVTCAVGAVPRCTGALTGYTLSLSGTATCTTANTIPTGDSCTATFTSGAPCGSNGIATFGAKFALTF